MLTMCPNVPTFRFDVDSMPKYSHIWFHVDSMPKYSHIWFDVVLWYDCPNTRSVLCSILIVTLCQSALVIGLVLWSWLCAQVSPTFGLMLSSTCDCAQVCPLLVDVFWLWNCAKETYNQNADLEDFSSQETTNIEVRLWRIDIRGAVRALSRVRHQRDAISTSLWLCWHELRQRTRDSYVN